MIGPVHLPQSILSDEAPASGAGDPPKDLDAIKRQRLVQALESSGGNQLEAARLLGISRTSVWNQMKKFGLKA